jgi:hypothetical protein
MTCKLLFIVSLLFAPIQAAEAQTFTPIRVNCGGDAYMDSKGQLWQADTGFTGGAVYAQAQTITGTSDPALFQDVRMKEFTGSFSYSFPVPNGQYTANLYFAESWVNSPGRQFNIVANGVVALNHFDIFAKVGSRVADIESIPVTVTNGSLTIEMDDVNGSTGFIDALEIVSATLPPPVPQPMAPIQVKACERSNGFVAPCTFDNPVPPHSLGIVVGGMGCIAVPGGTSNCNTISDSQGNVWQIAPGAIVSDDNGILLW